MAGGSLRVPVSSTTKTGRHDIAESGIKQNKSNQIKFIMHGVCLELVETPKFYNY
jgi:hypothetical protein